MSKSYQQLADLLKQARQILNDTYLQDHTNAYSRWKVESDAAWLAKGIMLPYSSNIIFPSEKEVIAKALELHNNQTPIPSAPMVQSDISPAPSFTTAIPLTDVAEPTALISQSYSESDESKNSAPLTLTETADTVPDVTKADTDISVTPDDNISSELAEVQRISRLRSLLNKFMTTATDLESKNTKNKSDDV